MAEFTWHNDTVTVTLAAPDDGPVMITDICATGSARPGAAPHRAHQPLVEILAPIGGNAPHANSGRWTGTGLGADLRLTDTAETATPSRTQLVITQVDRMSGVQVATTLTMINSIAAIHASSEVSLTVGHAPITLWGITSFATGAVISDDLDALDLWTADNAWAAEHRWSSQPLRAAGLTGIVPGAHGETIRGAISRTSYSTWSSGVHVPVAALVNRMTGSTLAWQIEHNGGWHWQVGELAGRGSSAPVAVGEHQIGRPCSDHSNDGAFIALLGPTDEQHHWSHLLAEGSTFSTIGVTVSVAGSLDGALGELTRYRRATRRPHPHNDALPVIFNDYMDTLEGDPSEDKLLPLIDAAAEVGSEYFCIDAGWYDDTAGWWASVGDWQPSTARFPRGLGLVLDHIRARGMVAGLWMEPEVVGVTSQAAQALPDDAFMQRDGVRLRERSRFFLDLRSPAARAHIDEAVDRLVGDLGVGFFKFDYNVTPGAGSDLGDGSVGQHLLEHNRALLTWLDGLLDRHPTLVIENCGSGAMRSDFAMLSRLQLQSTSDQQDPLLYPAIAVGALAHILPEQAGNWSYPQADYSDELIAFNLCTGMAGRVYQAGLLHLMNDDQKALVADGLRVHKQTRGAIAKSIPHFPTGLPNWDHTWVTVAFEGEAESYLIAWRQQVAEPTAHLCLPHLAGRDLAIEQIYPGAALPTWTITRTGDGVDITSASTDAAARMWRITAG